MLANQVNDIPLTLIPEKNTVYSFMSKRPPVDIEFIDLSYTVPQGTKGSKLILRSVSGLFKSGQLTAILGPSGAGKSTLLNVLAGYRCEEASGNVLINGKQRNMQSYRKMSRYIMQQDLLQPHLTVYEAMVIAASLKLGSEVSKNKKLLAVEEILGTLLLKKTRNTPTHNLSGGEKKRLSIALELVNNPPLIFLDEPTTGLDDLSSTQCISLLKTLAHGGRTVICSIHTPSAKLFAMFDHVYVIATGHCVFQGSGSDIVPFLSEIGIECPKHYNPADFVIEVSSGEYGDYMDKMVSLIDNGHCYCWSQNCTVLQDKNSKNAVEQVNEVDNSRMSTRNLQENSQQYDFNVPFCEQIKILLYRIFLQLWRDKTKLLMQSMVYLFLIFLIGSLYYKMGHDGSKQLFNFGFCYTCIISFLYLPLLPVLLQFPYEVRLLKREFFNRWYSLSAYYCATTIGRIPLLIIPGTIYVVTIYWLSDQPMELERICQFVVICLLIGFVSESIGLTIASRLSILNSMFIGPTLSVPMMLFAVYGMGSGTISIPIYMRILMYLSYLRFGFEGLMYAIYGNDRELMPCPSEEEYCHFRIPKTLLTETGMESSNIWTSVLALIVNIVFFKTLCFFLLRRRLSSHRNFTALNYVQQIIKSHFRSSPRSKR